MLTYEDLLRLSDDVQITYEYQPVKYQPQHSVVHAGVSRNLLKNREDEANVLGTVDSSILRKLCYDAE